MGGLFPFPYPPGQIRQRLGGRQGWHGSPEEDKRNEANERADGGPAGYRGSCANFAVDQK